MGSKRGKFKDVGKEPYRISCRVFKSGVDYKLVLLVSALCSEMFIFFEGLYYLHLQGGSFEPIQRIFHSFNHKHDIFRT